MQFLACAFNKKLMRYHSATAAEFAVHYFFSYGKIAVRRIL